MNPRRLQSATISSRVGPALFPVRRSSGEYRYAYFDWHGKLRALAVDVAQDQGELAGLAWLPARRTAPSSKRALTFVAPFAELQREPVPGDLQRLRPSGPCRRP